MRGILRRSRSRVRAVARCARPTCPARKQTTLKGAGAIGRRSRDALTHCANNRARRICSARRARRPSAPKWRSTIHSFSARKRRPSWMPVSIRFWTARGFDGLEIFGRQRERRAQHVHPTAIEHAEIEGREQPLVRIDDDRVRTFGAAQNPSVLGDHRGDTGVGGIDVQPYSLALADGRNLARLDRCWSSTLSRRSPRPRSGRSRPRGRRRLPPRARPGACETRRRRRRARSRRGRARAGSSTCRSTSVRARNSKRGSETVRRVPPVPQHALRNGQLARRGQRVQTSRSTRCRR